MAIFLGVSWSSPHNYESVGNVNIFGTNEGGVLKARLVWVLPNALSISNPHESPTQRQNYPVKHLNGGNFTRSYSNHCVLIILLRPHRPPKNWAAGLNPLPTTLPKSCEWQLKPEKVAAIIPGHIVKTCIARLRNDPSAILGLLLQKKRINRKTW